MKKLSILLLALIPFLAFANGQSDTSSTDGVTVNPTGFPIVDQTITQSWVVSYLPTGVPWDEISVVQEYMKKTNMDIDWISIPVAQVTEKVNIIIASGHLPDVFIGTAIGSNWANDYGSQGLFIPLQDLVAKWGPNISRMLEQVPLARDASMAPDGNMYSLPRIDPPNHPVVPNKLYVNQDWLKVLGMDYPQTADEFYAYLIGIRDNDVNGNGDSNDEIPMSLISHSLNTLEDRDSWMKIMGPWGVESELPIRDGKVTVGFASENYREALRFFKRLIDEDLFDIESFAQDDAVLKAKAVVGGDARLGVFTKMAAFQTVGASNAGTGLPKEERSYTAIAPFKGPLGDRLWYHDTAQRLQSGFVTITMENELPEAAIRWVDAHTIAPANQEWNLFPLDMYDEVSPGLFREPSTYPNGWSFAEARHRLSTGASGFVMVDPELDKEAGWSKYVEPFSQSDLLIEDANIMEAYAPAEMLNPKLLGFTDDERDFLTTYQTDLLSYVSESMAQFMVGDLDIEADWSSYLKQLTSLKVDKLREIYQAAYDRSKS